MNESSPPLSTPLTPPALRHNPMTVERIARLIHPSDLLFTRLVTRVESEKSLRVAEHAPVSRVEMDLVLYAIDKDESGARVELDGVVICTMRGGLYLPDISKLSLDELVEVGTEHGGGYRVAALGLHTLLKEAHPRSKKVSQRSKAPIPWLHMGTIETSEPLRGRKISWLLLWQAFRFAGRNAYTTLTCHDALRPHWMHAGRPLVPESGVYSRPIFSKGELGAEVEWAVVYDHRNHPIQARCPHYPRISAIIEEHRRTRSASPGPLPDLFPGAEVPSDG